VNIIQLERLLKENPAAIAAVQKMTAVKLQGKGNRKVQAATALKDKDHPSHQKAVSIFQKLKDKFSKKKEDEPKKQKQSQSDADFYKKQYAGRTGKELTRKEIKQYIIGRNTMKITEGALRKVIRSEIKQVLITEGSPGFTRREFGDPLPTFNDVKKTHQNKVVKEADDAFDQPIPQQIDRHMKKFIIAVQGARLNRRRIAAILGRVIVALKLDPSDLMKYIRLVKRDL
jgi:hypothetical protein